MEILSEIPVQDAEQLAEAAEILQLAKQLHGEGMGAGIISMWPMAGHSTGNRESPTASLEKSSSAQIKA